MDKERCLLNGRWTNLSCAGMVFPNTIRKQWKWTRLHTRSTQQASTQATETISCFSHSRKSRTTSTVFWIPRHTLTHSLQLWRLVLFFLHSTMTLLRPAIFTALFFYKRIRGSPILHLAVRRTPQVQVSLAAPLSISSCTTLLLSPD